MNSRAPDGRHVQARGIFHLLCKTERVHSCASATWALLTRAPAVSHIYLSARGRVFSASSRMKSRLKKAWIGTDSEGWDEGVSRQRSRRSSSHGFTTGWELSRGGLEVWGISVQLWEPSVKNLNHFLSLLLPFHSRSPRFCFSFSHRRLQLSLQLSGRVGLACFFIHTQEGQLVQSCLRCLDSCKSRNLPSSMLWELSNFSRGP